jgi:hypothetical protein
MAKYGLSPPAKKGFPLLFTFNAFNQVELKAKAGIKTAEKGLILHLYITYM